MIRVPMNATVVEYETARMILYYGGFKIRRENDYILVFSDKDADEPFFANKKDNNAEDAIDSLYVDEGFFTGCLHMQLDNDNGDIILLRSPANYAWEELVDFTGLLRIFVKTYYPESRIEASPFIGRGFTDRHYREQYEKILLEGKSRRYPELMFTEK